MVANKGKAVAPPPRVRKTPTGKHKIRTLGQIAGVVYHVNPRDPRVRLFAIRVFTLAELEFFMMLFNSVRLFHTEKSWLCFVQQCVESPGNHPGIWITIRRKLGLPDYSIRTICKHLFRGFKIPDAMPPIINAIIEANLEMGLIELLSERKKGDPESDGDYSGTIASMFIHKGILPRDYLSMTVKQLNAIVEGADSEAASGERKTGREDALAAARKKGGIR